MYHQCYGYTLTYDALVPLVYRRGERDYGRVAEEERLGPVERRASRRFVIEREVSYKILDQRTGPPETGSGLTVNFSRRGVLFRTDQLPRAGKRVEISVDWPAPLSGDRPLKFVALGHVVRVNDGQVAVSIEQYEFRTRRRTEL